MKKILLAAILLLSSCAADTTGNEIVSSAPETVSVSEETKVNAETESEITSASGEENGITEFKVSSADLKGGYWDIVISHDKGEDQSPELTWESVPEASCYAVYMVDPDGGNWVHMKAVTEKSSLSAGEVVTRKTGGENDNIGRYIGPYPPSGVHTYNIYVLALKESVEYKALPGGVNNSFKAAEAEDYISLLQEKGLTVIAKGKLSGKYPEER